MHARKRMDALPPTGPLRSGGRWRSTRRAMRTMRIVFCQCMDALSKNSVGARGPVGQDVRRARSRGAISFGYFSFGKKRKVTRALAPERSCFGSARKVKSAALSGISLVIGRRGFGDSTASMNSEDLQRTTPTDPRPRHPDPPPAPSELPPRMECAPAQPLPPR